MQKKSYTIGSLIILLICAFVFVIVPVLSGSGKQAEDPYIGSYDGKEIRYSQDSDFATAVSNYASSLQNQGVTLDINNQFYVYQYAFNSTVAQMAYEQAVAKSGYEVTEQTVNRELANNFVDVNGNYSDTIYRQYLNAYPSDVNKMRNNIKRMLTSSRFQQDLYGDDNFVGELKVFGLKSSTSELNFLSNMNTTKRGFNVVSFDMNEYPLEEKVAFGKANASKFVEYDMSVITVEDEATAKKVAARLTNGELTFDDAISEYSNKRFSGSDGRLYYPYDYQVQNFLAKEANIADITGLKEGEVSGIIPTEYDNGDTRTPNYSIFLCKGPSKAPDFEDEATIQAVFNYISSKEMSLIENYYFAKATELLKAEDKEAAAAELNALFNVMDPIPLNYGDATVAECVDSSIECLATASDNENFWKTAFSLKKDEWSSPMVMNDFVVLLQYTTDENTTVDDNYIVPSEVRDIDTQTGNKELLNSPKVKNEVMNFVFSNMNF